MAILLNLVKILLNVSHQLAALLRMPFGPDGCISHKDVRPFTNLMTARCLSNVEAAGSSWGVKIIICANNAQGKVLAAIYALSEFVCYFVA